MKPKKYVNIIATLAVVTIILSTGISSAYADSNEYVNYKKGGKLAEQQMAILEAFENEDYKAWKLIIGENSLIAKEVGHELFSDFIKARKLARNGSYDEALSILNEISQELEVCLNNINDPEDTSGELKRIKEKINEISSNA